MESGGGHTKLYGGHGPLNSSFTPRGVDIVRTILRNSSAPLFGVRK